MANELTRETLIGLCEAGSVPESRWSDRDSAGAQLQLGECLMLLRAGCEWRIDESMDDRAGSTHWVEIRYKGFDWFEEHVMSEDLFYVPSSERLAKVAGGDWY